MAHTKLSHSKAFIVRAYLLQTHEMLFDALTQAFRVLGGVPRRGIFDNMKTAVDRIGAGKARQVNARFSAMASHYPSRPAQRPPPGRRSRRSPAKQDRYASAAPCAAACGTCPPPL